MDDRQTARLRWHCRRGMRELDVLLRGYLDSRYAEAPAAEQAAFRALLERQDPELHALLLGRMAADDEDLARVLELLRRAP